MVLVQKELQNAYIGEAPITTPGIYHSASLGLISISSDGSTRYTIADKNLGATTVWNYGETVNATNAGGYFQWGNNYMFPFSGGMTTSSGQVNVSSYGPGNYYSSSTFRTGSYDWASPSNFNLRGGGGDFNDSQRGLTNLASTVEDRKGPCDSGYHVPCMGEWERLLQLRAGLRGYTLTGTYPNLDISGSSSVQNAASIQYRTDFYIPPAGYIDNGANIYNQGLSGGYFSSSPQNNNNYSYAQNITNYSLSALSAVRAAAYSIRPFKNNAVQPKNNRTVLYQN